MRVSMRGHRNVFDEEKETKKMLYISGAVLVVAIIAFVITFVVYTNSFNDDGVEIAKAQNETNGISSSEASNPIIW